MMGIERSHRSQGWGLRLITEALSWASQWPTIEWIDLYVFAHNKPAIDLYTKVGFLEAGRVVDMFRVKGQKIEDIQMVIKLHR
jgi:ribosomal protein S18 acetylase RimI-like enzyme